MQGVDDIFQVIWVGYRYWKPFSVFREVNINFNQWTGHNFAGELSYFGGNVNLNTQLKNYWNVGFGLGPQGPSLNFTALRGGPALSMPGSVNYWMSVSSDGRKKFKASANASGQQGESIKHTSYSLSLTWKPTNALDISVKPSVSSSEKIIQYVSNIQWGDHTRYINASINQNVYAVQLNVNYSITPDLSVQFYGRPFFAKGRYFDFKHVASPRANKFSDRFTELTSSQLSYSTLNNEYNVDENTDGVTDYSFGNPDFNVGAFQSNMVIRWEYKPGSTLFLVWSQGRDSYDYAWDSSLNYSANELLGAYPHNVFLVKLAYRFY